MGFKGAKYSVSDRSPDRKWLLAGLVLVAIVSSAAVFFWLRQKENKIITSNSSDEVAVEKTGTVNGTYLFSGTVVLARAVERAAAGNYEQPFSQLETFQPNKYDGWLVDLECPVTSNNVSYQQQINNLVFNCRPEWLPVMSKYFTFANLANNHTSDMGEDGFEETQRNLEQAGVQTVGNYDPSKTQDACEVMALPVQVTTEVQETRGTMPIAICAFHYFFRKPIAGEMDVIKKYAEVMPTFGLMHVGVEYVATAGIEQQGVARAMIDNGSEFVIGNSPHWVQNSEVYKDKPIFYSTGNFIFDQLEPETNRGLSIEVTMGVEYDKNIEKWLALGERCKSRRDDCLEMALNQQLQKPKIEFKYAPIASEGGNRAVTKRAGETVQRSVEERLNWLQTKQQLKQ